MFTHESLADALAARVLSGTYSYGGSFDSIRSVIDWNIEQDTYEVIVRASDDQKLFTAFREDKRVFSAYGVLEHELAHWYQSVGTAYGYYLRDSRESAARAVGTFVVRRRRRYPGKPVPKPLAEWARHRYRQA